MALPEFPTFDLDLKKALGDMNLPNVDVEGLMEIHRKNMEAVAQVNRTAAEGIQELVRSQADLVKETMSEIAASVKDMASAGTAEDRATRQADVLKTAMERAFTNIRSVGELAMKTNTDVFNTVNGRITESMEELKALAGK